MCFLWFWPKYLNFPLRVFIVWWSHLKNVDLYRWPLPEEDIICFRWRPSPLLLPLCTAVALPGEVKLCFLWKQPKAFKASLTQAPPHPTGRPSSRERFCLGVKDTEIELSWHFSFHQLHCDSFLSISDMILSRHNSINMMTPFEMWAVSSSGINMYHGCQRCYLKRLKMLTACWKPIKINKYSYK